MLFPVAGVELHPLVLLAIGLGIGTLSGLFGVGGGFLATPILIWMGVPPVCAVGSNLNQTVGAASSGASLKARLGNVWYRVAAFGAAGGLPAGVGATFLVRHLRSGGSFGRTLGVIHAVLLTAIGVRMILELRKRRGAASPAQAEARPRWGRRNDLAAVAIGAGAGALSAFLGVGGGVVLVPIMIYVLRVPARLAIGTSLFQVMIVAFGLTICHAAVNANSVDVVLAALLMLGSIPGTWLGVWLGRRLKTGSLLGLFGVVVLVAAAKMIWDVAAGGIGGGIPAAADLGPFFSGVRAWAASGSAGMRLLYGLAAAGGALLLGGTLGTFMRRRVCGAAGSASPGRSEGRAAPDER